MTNTKSEIEIIKGFKDSEVLVIKEKPCDGGGINETQEENKIYDANIIYEF